MILYAMNDIPLLGSDLAGASQKLQGRPAVRDMAGQIYQRILYSRLLINYISTQPPCCNLKIFEEVLQSNSIGGKLLLIISSLLLFNLHWLGLSGSLHVLRVVNDMALH